MSTSRRPASPRSARATARPASTRPRATAANSPRSARVAAAPTHFLDHPIGSPPPLTNGAHVIDNRHFVAIFLHSLEVHTRNFLSKDLFKNTREGVVRFDCCGESTAWTFQDDTDSSGSPVVSLSGSSLLFLGLHPRRLSLGIQIMESDENVRKSLTKASDIIGMIGGSPLAALPPAVSPSARLVSNLLTQIKARIHDHQEMQFFAVYDDALKDGMQLAVEGVNKAGKTVLKASFEILDLGAARVGEPLSIRVGTPAITFEQRSFPGMMRGTPGWASRPGGRQPLTSRTPVQWMDTLKAHWFACEASSGRNSFAYSARLNQASQTVVWHQAELFVAATGSSSTLANRHLIPFSLSLALVPQELKPETLLDIAGQAVDVAKAFQLDTTRVQDVLKKSQPMIGPALASLSGKSIPLFTFEGLLFLMPDGAPTGIAQRLATHAGVLPLVWDVSQNLWTTPAASIPRKFKFQGNPMGTIKIRIDARAMG